MTSIPDLRARQAALRQAARDEAAELVRLAAEPPGRRNTTQARIYRASLRLGWSYKRTEGVWYKLARRIESWELDQLRALSPDNPRPVTTVTAVADDRLTRRARGISAASSDAPKAKKPTARATARRRALLPALAVPPALAPSTASWQDRAVKYARLAEMATNALEKRRHENLATFYRFMAQEAARTAKTTRH